MTIRLLHLAAALLTALVFAGCGKTPDRADVVIINGAEPKTLDPAKISGQPEGRVAYCLFEGLTRYRVDGTTEPGMAERWEISPDGRKYTFHLRAAQWSNGDAVTAHDFAWSWMRVLREPEAEYRYQMYYLRGGEEFAKALDAQRNPDPASVGVRAQDDRTLVVELKNPTPYFIDLVAFYTFCPVHRPTVEASARTGKPWLRPGVLVANGAFTMEEWRTNYSIRMKKNPRYWDAANVRMNSIDALSVSSPTTAFNFYHSGVADLLPDKSLVPTSIVPDLKKRPDYHATPVLATYFIRFNTGKKPFDDPRVRRAISMVIDKTMLTEKITQAGEPPTDAFTPPGTAGYQPPPGLKRDIEAARKLLAEAGYPGGAGFPLVKYLYTNRAETDDKIAVELQSMFKETLGISIGLQKQEWSVYLTTLQGLDYDFARSSWVGDYLDPNTFLDMWLTGGGNNETGWSNKRYDELIATAAAEPDNKKRFEHFVEAEKILLHEAPVCPLFNYVVIMFYRDNLGGVQGNQTDEHPFRTLYWKDRK